LRGIDLLVGGTPCFSGDTLIATQRGFVPICEINTGDMVLTHKNRWRKVLSIGNKEAETIKICGQGASDGLHTTPEHPIYSREQKKSWVGRKNGSWKRIFSEPSWTEAGKMKGRFWGSPAQWESLQIPEIITQGNEATPPKISTDLMRFLGRWLGDGWLRFCGNRRSYVLLCLGKHEGNEVLEIIENAGLHASVSNQRTTVRYQVASSALARWILQNFGQGAKEKTIPAWLFSASREMRLAFLEGYLSADGNRITGGWNAVTVSKCLAVGITMLAHSLGYSTTRTRLESKRASIIEGRHVKVSDCYQVHIYKNARSSVEIDGHRWGFVRKILPSGICRVWNLEVEEDNSYVADSITVHNCQDFSVAGLRKGLAGENGNLAIEFIRLADRLRPRWLVWENVPGVLSVDGGRAFGIILGELAKCGYGLAWRVLDAEYYGVPQRRRRVFLTGYYGNWRPPAAVLFERQSLSGNPPPSRGQGAEVASKSKSGTRSGGSGRDVEVTQALTGRLGGGGPDDNKAQGGFYVPLVSPTVTGGPPFSRTGNSRVETEALVFGGNNTSGAVDVTPALLRGSGRRQDFESEAIVVTPIAFHGSQDPDVSGDVTHPLGRNNGLECCVFQESQAVRTGSQVRRLTPIECERLQGFPDNYTLLKDWNGWRYLDDGEDPDSLREAGFQVRQTKKSKRWRVNDPDGPRYKVIGNSMATCVVRWLGERIELVEALLKNLASSVC